MQPDAYPVDNCLLSETWRRFTETGRLPPTPSRASTPTATGGAALVSRQFS
ncbi:MAG: hypothetical protein ACOC9Z_03345 [Chloroflexota bacterium]